MTFLTKEGTFDTGTGAVSSTVVVNDVGFQPKAIFFWWSGTTSGTDATASGDIFAGCGLAVSTSDRRAVCFYSLDAQAAAVGASGHHDAACVEIIGSGDAIDGLLDLQSMDSGGFTLVVDDQFSVSRKISYLALGGTDISNVASGQVQLTAVTGTQDITSLSFQPDFILTIGAAIDTSAPPAINANMFGMMIGAAVSSSARALTSVVGDDAANTMEAKSYCYGAEIAAHHHGNTLATAGRADFVQFLSNGFQVTKPELATAFYMMFLAIKGGQYAVGDLLTQTDTTTDIVETVGFEPKALLFVSHGMAQSTQDTIQADLSLSIGAATSPTARVAQAVYMQDATADSECTVGVEYDEVYINVSNADAVEGLMDLKSIESTGFTCIMDDADPAQAFVWYVAFGAAAGGGVTVTPAAASSGATAIAPSVRLGSVSVSPANAASGAAAINPTVVQASMTVAPATASSPATAVSPTVVLSSVSVSPAAASSGATAVSPTVVQASMTVAPAAASSGAAAVNPTVVISGGGVTVTPAAATSPATAIAPTVRLGSVSVSPANAASPATAVNPNVVQASMTVAPAAAASPATAVNPTVVISGGGVTVTPAAAASPATAVSPAVRLSSMTVTPAAATSPATAVNPMVRLGSLNLSPVAAVSPAAAVNPNVVISGGGITVSPAAATSITTAIAPAVRLSSLSVAPVQAVSVTAAIPPSVGMSSMAVAPAAAVMTLTAINPTVVVAFGIVGRIRIAVSAKSPGVSASAKTVGVSVSASQPGIDVEEG